MILINNGQNVNIIAERLGNSSAMMFEFYGLVMKALEERSMEVCSIIYFIKIKSGDCDFQDYQQIAEYVSLLLVVVP